MSNPSPSAPSSDSSYSRLSRRGKHKIFIGMAPGVGKTYRMLEEAQLLKKEGIDVVVGLLETYGRKETTEKAKGLEMVPTKEITLFPSFPLALSLGMTSSLPSPELIKPFPLAPPDLPPPFLRGAGGDQPPRGAGGGSTMPIVPSPSLTGTTLSLREMDAEAILVRQPQLVLVDELAHTNVSGSPREKRYQDVEVILAAGIDVFSTVNIQHLDSLNDLVARITSVVVEERIPDRLLDEADEVVVIDVTPETLEERLLEGKIYAPEKISSYHQNFFQRRNLVALRKLALREVADNIEEDVLRDARQQSGNVEARALQFCTIHERVLVCLSTEFTSVQLLRHGARIASHMNAALYALFFTKPECFLTKAETLHLETCEKLCQEFGGEFLRVYSENITETVAEVANTYHITQIVLDRNRKSWWRLLPRESFIDRLLRSIDKIDLHIIDAATTKHDSIFQFQKTS